MRTSTIFVAICMVLIAGSLGMALHAATDLGASQSAVVALAALAVMILHHAVSIRLADRPRISDQIADLSRGTADLARQVGEFGRRLNAIEGRLASANTASQDRLRALHDEINELGDLVNQLAGAVAAHDDVLMDEVEAAAASSARTPSGRDAAPATIPPAPPPRQPAPPSAMKPPAVAPAAVAPPPPSAAAPAPVENDYLDLDVEPANDDAALVRTIRAAIDANQIEIYLQPIVTLPQRKVRFYEAVTRLRDAGGQVLAAEDFIATAEAAALMGRIDHGVILRCVQVLRRLTVRNKDAGIFCNVSHTTLADPASFAQCLDFLDANRALAPCFVLEFRQGAFNRLGPVEREHLAALAQRGFRFSLDHVEDLRIEPRDLADRGVRFIKVQAALLLDPRHAAAADIHAADLADLLGRFGIDLIAERIEGERAVVDLLDYNVRFGQGFLFAAPRPLRPEADAARSPPAAAPPPDKPLREAPVAAHTPDPRRIDPPRATGNAALARRAVRPH